MIKNLGFAQKIILCSVATVVIALMTFSLVTYLRMSGEVEQTLENKIRQIATATTDNLSQWLSTKLELTEAVAARAARLENDASFIDLISAVRAGGDFRNVFYGTEAGRFLIDDTNTDDLSGFDPRSRPWYQLAKTANKPSFSEPYNDAITKELLITSVAPVNDTGFKGVVGGDINLTTISETVNSLDLQGLGNAFLVDSTGKVLASPEASEIGQSVSGLYSSEVNIEPVLQNVPNASGSDRILAFYPIKGIESVRWYVGIDIDENAAYASLSDFRNSAIISTLVVALLASLILSYLLKRLTAPLLQLRDALFNIAQGEGDLTQRLNASGHDELGQVAEAFNGFIGNIHILIEDFKGSSENLGTMVTNMAEVSDRSRNECQRQQQETDMVAAAVSQMSAAAQEIATHAQNAADAAREADSEGNQAGLVVNEAISSIRRLAEEIDAATTVINDLENDVSNISSMVDVIRGIADQTNLLALNAAIEAARAGEQGRGFAVVADEVRTLASKTQDSTEEINRLIERLQSGSKQAVQAMATSRDTGEQTVVKANEAGQSLESIARAVSTISDMNIQIATASEEQTAVTEDIARNITAIADATISVTEAATETDENSQRLSEIGASIREKVERFKV